MNCLYCHREGEALNGGTEMTPEEIRRIVEIAASFGIRNVKLTGGEPLLRNDIAEIVKGIQKVIGIKEISMTTNGILLDQYALSLKTSGLTRVNVSLDTLRNDRFRLITGADALQNVISGIKKAVKTGLTPVKLNMVPLEGINQDEIMDVIKFAKENKLILQIIELHSSREDASYKKYYFSLIDIEKYLESTAQKVRVRKMHHRKLYLLKDGTEVEIVKPMHNTEFCRYCNRIRVTSDGKLKPCLFRNDNLVDFLGPLREGASEESLKSLFLEAIGKRKPYFT